MRVDAIPFPAIRRKSVAYLGAYPPSSAPSAMFTLDLVNATDLHGWQSVVVAAVDSAQLKWHRIDSAWRDRKIAAVVIAGEPATFGSAARALQREEISAVCLHLAPDVYAPSDLPALARLASCVRCPLVVAMHAVDRAPTAEQVSFARALLPLADMFVVMTHAAESALHSAYGVPRAKIRCIPYGTPFVQFGDAASGSAKQALGLAGRRVLTSFGALRPGRGIEDVLAALPEIIREHPDALYAALCPSTPIRGIGVDQKLAFRSAHLAQLRAEAADAGLGDHVRFVEETLSMRMRIEYLAATDIFIDAEHAQREKSASATLAYAFAAGNLVVATPTPHAKDLLARGRGYLFPFRDSQALARRVCAALADPEEFRAVRERAYAHSRGMTWEDVGLKYATLFDELIQARRHPSAELGHRS